MTKKYVLEVFLDDEAGIMYHEQVDGGVFGNDLRLIISVLEQVKTGMLIQLNTQARTVTAVPKKPGRKKQPND